MLAKYFAFVALTISKSHFQLYDVLHPPASFQLISFTYILSFCLFSKWLTFTFKKPVFNYLHRILPAGIPACSYSSFKKNYQILQHKITYIKQVKYPISKYLESEEKDSNIMPHMRIFCCLDSANYLIDFSHYIA